MTVELPISGFCVSDWLLYTYRLFLTAIFTPFSELTVLIWYC